MSNTARTLREMEFALAEQGYGENGWGFRQRDNCAAVYFGEQVFHALLVNPDHVELVAKDPRYNNAANLLANPVSAPPGWRGPFAPDHAGKQFRYPFPTPPLSEHFRYQFRKGVKPPQGIFPDAILRNPDALDEMLERVFSVQAMLEAGVRVVTLALDARQAEGAAAGSLLARYRSLISIAEVRPSGPSGSKQKMPAVSLSCESTMVDAYDGAYPNTTRVDQVAYVKGSGAVYEGASATPYILRVNEVLAACKLAPVIVATSTLPPGRVHPAQALRL